MPLDFALWLLPAANAAGSPKPDKVDLDKQDRRYIYLNIEPRSKKSSSWFEFFPERWFNRCRIVLERKTYQVRQMWFDYLNGTEVVVDFYVRRTKQKEPITKESLLKGLRQGWKREEIKVSGK